jgi:hypothetical protein
MKTWGYQTTSTCFVSIYFVSTHDVFLHAAESCQNRAPATLRFWARPMHLMIEPPQ